MSEGAAAPSNPAGSVAVHANTANDATSGANMPSVPANTQRMRPSDFARMRRSGELPTRAAPVANTNQQPAPPTRREHMAEVSRALEARANNNVRDDKQRGTQFDEPAGKEPTPATNVEVPQQHDPSEQSIQEPATEDGTAQEPLSALSPEEKLAKFQEWQDSDLFPDELLGKMHEVKVRGQTRYVDTNELRQGYMRHGDYQARGMELKQREARAAESENLYKQHFEAIRDPDQFLEIYERNGYGDVMERVAERIAERRVEHRNLVRAAGRATAEQLGFTSEQINRGEADRHHAVVEAMQRADQRLKAARGTEIENRKLAGERERFEAQRREAAHRDEVATHKATYDKQLAQLRPVGFKAFGIPDSPQTRTAFINRLREVVDLQGGITDQGFTRDLVMAAARAVAEDIGDRQQSEGGQFMSEAEARAQQQARARQAALGATRTGTGGGKPLQSPNVQARRPSEFEAMRRAGTLGKR
jgi:uncharacterized protein YifE (UPF0438 family)